MVDRDDAERDLVRLRDAIDRVDEVLVRLLNQRAKYAVEIGELKGLLGLPIYAPDREKQVLQHAEQTSDGPLEMAMLPQASAVKLVNTVPTAMVELVKQKAIPDSVQTINLAGEALSQKLVEEIYENSKVAKVFDLHVAATQRPANHWQATRQQRGLHY